MLGLKLGIHWGGTIWNKCIFLDLLTTGAARCLYFASDPVQVRPQTPVGSPARFGFDEAICPAYLMGSYRDDGRSINRRLHRKYIVGNKLCGGDS